MSFVSFPSKYIDKGIALKPNDRVYYNNLGKDLALFIDSYPYRSLDDVLYFALAAFKECHFDPRADKVLLTGDNHLRATLTEQLRERIAHVMPEVFPPQALTLGKEAMTMPFSIIATAFYSSF